MAAAGAMRIRRAGVGDAPALAAPQPAQAQERGSAGPSSGISPFAFERSVPPAATDLPLMATFEDEPIGTSPLTIVERLPDISGGRPAATDGETS